MFFRISLRFLAKYLILITIFIVLFNEYIIFLLYRYCHWHQIPCSSGNCTRILFVADPQILGETFDTHLYSNLANLDVDRFLKTSFVNGLKHSKPDIVCFMGDLMDEGSVASTIQYNNYLKRFKHIYYIDPESVQVMYIPGDNDIGGERSDVVTEAKTKRFKIAFDEHDIIDTKYAKFININLLTHKYPNVSNKNDILSNPVQTHIVVTHLSLISYPGIFMDKVIETFKPNIIFSAHSHLSRILTYPPLHINDFNGNSIIAFNITGGDRSSVEVNNGKTIIKQILEIMIPTCSYRMGVMKIGFGMAVIDNNQLKYTVLWLPNRFLLLCLYLFWLIIIVLILFVWKCINYKSSLIYHRCRRNNRYLPTKV